MTIREAQKVYKRIGKLEKMVAQGLTGIQAGVMSEGKTYYDYACMIVKGHRGMEKMAAALSVPVYELTAQAHDEDRFVLWAYTKNIQLATLDDEEDGGDQE